MLGLMVGSIHTFVTELSRDKIIQGHVEKARKVTIGRSISATTDIKRLSRESRRISVGRRPVILHEVVDSSQSAKQISFHPDVEEDDAPRPTLRRRMTLTNVVSMPVGAVQRIVSRKPKLIILREEKDRFDAMREIQRETKVFKRYYNLVISIVSFGILLCGGAAVFQVAEHKEQGLSYFEAFYFCYVSLLTIGKSVQ
jgi:potassium channel subfamily K